ncbi:MAG: hypothetical protein ACQEWV_21385 [Bacillota bacterium]
MNKTLQIIGRGIFGVCLLAGCGHTSDDSSTETTTKEQKKIQEVMNRDKEPISVVRSLVMRKF